MELPVLVEGVVIGIAYEVEFVLQLPQVVPQELRAIVLLVLGELLLYQSSEAQDVGLVLHSPHHIGGLQAKTFMGNLGGVFDCAVEASAEVLDELWDGQHQLHSGVDVAAVQLVLEARTHRLTLRVQEYGWPAPVHVHQQPPHFT
jgi:hypothetical protein